jgi:hypothetical protein
VRRRLGDAQRLQGGDSETQVVRGGDSETHRDSEEETRRRRSCEEETRKLERSRRRLGDSETRISGERPDNLCTLLFLRNYLQTTYRSL